MKQSGHGWRFSTRVAAPMALVTLISIALTAFGLYWAVTRADAISIERQVRVAQRAVVASIEQVAAAQEPLAVWDEAFNKASAPPDPDWFRGGYVSFFEGMWPGGQVYILDGAGDVRYGARGDRLVGPEAFEPLRPKLGVMLAELRGDIVPRGHAHDRLIGSDPPPKRAGTLGRIDYVTYAAHLERVEGRPAVVSVMRVIPVTSRVSGWRGREPVLVNVRYLDETFLRELATRNLLDRPRFTADGRLAPGEVSIPLVSEDGGTVAQLAWRPERPGTRILGKLAPFAALSALLTALASWWLVRSLRRATDELQAREAAASREATHDALTGLPNRALFAERLEAAIAAAGAGGRAALLLLDLDRFKQVNDTMGHAAGDALLREFGRRVAEVIGPEDTVARFGGDEFGVVLRRAGAAAAEAAAVRVIEATRRPFGLAEGDAHVGVSVGIALLTHGSHEPTELLRAADRALYLAKAAGRNTFIVFRADPQAAGLSVVQLQEEVARRVA